MTKEEKELLLKDIFSRLPYGVICADIHADEKFINKWNIFSYDGFFGNFVQVCLSNCEKSYGYKTSIERIKPYLLPLSSMTEEQKKELNDKLIELELKALNDEISHIEVVKFEIDYYLKNHFDYRGLIPMGLALDATGLNIY